MSRLTALVEALLRFNQGDAGADEAVLAAGLDFIKAPPRVRTRELTALSWLSDVAARLTTGDILAWQLAKKVADGRYHVATLNKDGSSVVADGATVDEAILAWYDKASGLGSRSRRVPVRTEHDDALEAQLQTDADLSTPVER